MFCARRREWYRIRWPLTVDRWQMKYSRLGQRQTANGQRFMRLVLFDIDGTLISDGGAAREAYAFALHKVYGYRTELRRYDFSGRTDPQVTHMVLGDDGLSPRE